MGFGYLFLGYVVEYILGLNGYGAFVYLLGYVLIHTGLYELQRYCRKFGAARYCVIGLSVLSVYRTFEGIGSLFNLSFPFVLPLISRVVEWTELFGVLLFHLFLTVALRDLSEKVSLPRVSASATRNFSMIILYYILFVIYRFSGGIGWLWGMAMLVRLIWAICEAALLFVSYRDICPADESRRARKPSKIPFVNRFREAFDKKEAEAIEADRAFHTENAKRRKEKYMEGLSKKARAREEKKQK